MKVEQEPYSVLIDWEGFFPKRHFQLFQLLPMTNFFKGFYRLSIKNKGLLKPALLLLHLAHARKNFIAVIRPVKTAGNRLSLLKSLERLVVLSQAAICETQKIEVFSPFS